MDGLALVLLLRDLFLSSLRLFQHWVLDMAFERHRFAKMNHLDLHIRSTVFSVGMVISIARH